MRARAAVGYTWRWMDLLDRYKPLFVIGRGGMGTIEAAVESDGHGRVVALKRMLPGVQDRRHVDMFLREARLATLLNHENVVHAFAFGEQDGELYIAMEYLEGETLASLHQTLTARGERIPFDIAMYVLGALCDGLHAAHELRDVSGAPLGLVHRDVSPHNVMLSYAGEVKLLDFGVAKLHSAAHLTKTGEVKGKTAYMSPEQAMGDALDRRSNLYGVGAMLFEIVTGRPMWTGSTDLELLRQLALAEPPKLADVAPDAPHEIHDLHARLVAKKAKHRPANAHEVAETLRAFAPLSAQAMLTRLLADHYGEKARQKRDQLETALRHSKPSLGDAPSGEPGAVIALPTSARPSRMAPWAYALVGAAVASVAVLGFARRLNPTSPSVATTAAVPSQTASQSPAAPNPSITSSATPSPSPVAPPPPTRGSRSRPIGPAHSSVPAASTAAPPPLHPPIDVDPHAI